MKLPYLVIFIALLIVIFYLLSNRGESFTDGPHFVRAKDAEFRGINLLASISQDGHFATGNAEECEQVCKRNPECAGYGFYTPGNRCYMFMSGDFIGNRPGYLSGKKII